MAGPRAAIAGEARRRACLSSTAGAGLDAPPPA
jgi:hypothetical protein